MLTQDAGTTADRHYVGKSHSQVFIFQPHSYTLKEYAKRRLQIRTVYLVFIMFTLQSQLHATISDEIYKSLMCLYVRSLSGSIIDNLCDNHVDELPDINISFIQAVTHNG